MRSARAFRAKKAGRRLGGSFRKGSRVRRFRQSVAPRGGEFDRLRKPDDAPEDIIEAEAGRRRAASAPEIERQVAYRRGGQPVTPPGTLAAPMGREEARARRVQGYEGDACPECGQFTLVRTGALALDADGCANTGCSNAAF
ncbi:MAG: hypothetical protein R3C42_00275 [Parvularculaceae bacterium]